MRLIFLPSAAQQRVCRTQESQRIAASALRRIVGIVTPALVFAFWLSVAGASGAASEASPRTTVAPGADIQRAIDRALSGTTIVFRSGAYNIAARIRLKSGVSLIGQSGAVLKASGVNGIFEGIGVHDVLISGFVFDGGVSGGPGDVSGAIVLNSDGATPSSDITIENNVFENWTTSNALYLWHTQNTYIRRNRIRHGLQGISWMTDDPRVPALTTLVVAENVITDMTRMGIETGFATAVSDVHIDRNKLARIGGTERIAISMIGHVTAGTLHRNEISDQHWAIEIGGRTDFNVTVAGNIMTNCTWGISISRSPGSVIEDNIFTNVANPLSEDGGYDNTAWIGLNTVDGKVRSGWVGPGSAPHGPYGRKPLVHLPTSN